MSRHGGIGAGGYSRLLRWTFLLVCLCVSASAQATKIRKATGPVQLDTDDGTVAIHYDHRDWKIDVSNLPIRADECETGKSGAGCVTEWEPVAWDGPREIFYLAASTGTSHNRPWIVFSYHLGARQLTRIADENGGGFDDHGSVSPSGKYLAFVSYQVCGRCCTSTSLVVVDIDTRKVGSFEPDTVDSDEKARITGMRWTGPATIEYDAEFSRESECRDGTEKRVRSVREQLEAREVVKASRG